MAILDYHVKKEAVLDPVFSETTRMAGEDGLQAVRYLRAHAEEYGIKPDHIAIGGFSAGGILSGYAATKFDNGDLTAEDPLKRVSSRPDAALILYGAFSPTSSIPASTGGMTREQIAAACIMEKMKHQRNHIRLCGHLLLQTG